MRLRTDLTNLMADISVGCTLMCLLCPVVEVRWAAIYDVRSTGLAVFGFGLSEGSDDDDD
jgi:hypothetical protein